MKDAQIIYDSATAKMAEEAMDSIDYLERELERAYLNLKLKVGKARADEIAVDLVKISF